MPSSKQNEYLFVATVMASVTIKAPTQKAARKKLEKLLDEMGSGLQDPQSGDPVKVETVIDGKPTLIDVNGGND